MLKVLPQVSKRSLLKSLLIATLGLHLSAFTYAQEEKTPVLRWSSAGDFLTFDVHAQNESLNSSANAAVYESLVRFNKAMQIEPALATAWERVPEGFLFTIRENVKFHEGQILTAEDVAYSINRALMPESQFRALASGIEGADVINPRQVLVKTASGSPVFLNQLTSLRILCKSWLAEHKALRPQNYVAGDESYLARHANGTGPFKLASREVDVQTVFTANHDWWDEANRVGNVETVIYTPIASPATRTAALLSGEIDFVLDPAPQDLAHLERDARLKVLSYAEDRVMMIALDLARDNSPYVKSMDGKPLATNPFKDKRVREAMSLAVNRDALVKTIMRGRAVATQTIVSNAVAGYSAEIAKPAPYDLEKAKALLAQAGYEKGFAFTLDTPNNRWINDENLSKALASMWAKIGLKVNVNAMPRAQYFPKVLGFDTSAALVGWGSTTFDAYQPLQSLSATFNAETGAGISNVGRASDAELDRSIKALAGEADTEKRRALANEALAREKEEVLHIVLLQPQFSWAMQKRVEPVPRPDNRLTLEWVKVTP
ncbi:MAG TPA: ABC transporter substrate-binding protein [Candidatus Aphodousia gallistercoris]|nr:ABC transporter substrate-binding protein [Candidatus Aphodousia gallistercoris]